MMDAVETRAENREQWMAAILRTLQELSSAERNVFTLSHYYSWAPSEISRKLSLPIREIESLLQSASAKLARNLNYFRERAI
ncbi:MAG TPA: sigma factor-like helix-turn-helix DNA-binding protein [Acidobacteriota bacterium]|jgi:DNA-directed RNA polymerase specialized sigma24 family protein